MSVHHVVDSSHHLVVSTFSGQVTCNEIAAACTKLGHDRDFRPDYRQLADFSQVSLLDLRAEDINAIRQIYDPFSSQSRRAFVVLDRGATLGTVKSYQSIVQGQQLQIFPSLLDAISWLNLPVTVLPAVSMKSSLRLESSEASQRRSFESPCSPLRSFRPLRALAKGAENW
jgi:hypothetical protein